MNYIYKDELYHHGIKGQRWGVRRFQYENGTLTPDGRKRYEKVIREKRNYIDKKLAKDYAYHDIAVDYYNSKVPKGNSLSKASNMAKAAEHMRARDSLENKIEKRDKRLSDDAYNRMEKTRKKFMNKYGNCKVAYNVVDRSYTIQADESVESQNKKKELLKKAAIGTAITTGIIAAGYGLKG